MSERIGQVIEEFNRLLIYYKWMKRKGARYADPSTRETVEAFIQWCDEVEVDPVRFTRARIYHCMEELPKQMFPRLDQLRSPSLLKNGMWEDLADWFERLTYDQTVLRKELINEGDGHRARRPAWERFKERHAYARSVCMGAIRFSGGFHPHSEHCQSCSLAKKCADVTRQHYDYDIVRFRASCRDIRS